jgi:hypothetical protein
MLSNEKSEDIAKDKAGDIVIQASMKGTKKAG